MYNQLTKREETYLVPLKDIEDEALREKFIEIRKEQYPLVRDLKRKITDKLQ